MHTNDAISNLSHKALSNDAKEKLEDLMLLYDDINYFDKNSIGAATDKVVRWSIAWFT